ncbi:MAG TPA: NAD(P)-dependent oxidoreductase [Pirellulales bacterium]|nr:NAD(P)-dependent oxidoreductase [Pirellulales bacterium]
MNPIETEAQLEAWLSEPTPEVIETLARLPGDLVLLGVAGKMGPTLARMAKRAFDAAGIRRRVIGVARFSDGGQAELEAHGVETIRCDLLNEDDVARLPDAANVIFMTGRKFGSTGDEPLTWAMNAYLPAVVCRKYRRSRIVAFSTGNVYGLTPPARGGSREGDALQPAGEYAMSSVGRERMFAYFSRSLDIPLAIVRLNYACELRYGVLVDLAQRVARGEPVELSMGHFNVIWQGDANAMALRALARVSTPPWIVNVTGPETLSVREVCRRFGELLQKPVRLVGEESAAALLSNASIGLAQLGPPRVNADELIERVADWVARGGRSLGKPTHFESRDGRF